MAESRGTADRTYKSTDDFSKAYMRLRTVLDGMQISALRYCLEAGSTRSKIKRIAEIEKELLPMIRGIQDRLTMAPGGGGGCPDGYFDCGGVCVPYQCPKDSKS
jgi:hypothetical protein